MKLQNITIVAASILLLTACETLERRPGETLGSILGAGIGVMFGNKIGDGTGKIISSTIGGLTGTWLGNRLGKMLDERDVQQANWTAQNTFENNPTGVSSTWSNPDSGNSGSITPENTYQNIEGTYCRKFESVINVDNKVEKTKGHACRKIDGSWAIVH